MKERKDCSWVVHVHTKESTTDKLTQQQNVQVLVPFKGNPVEEKNTDTDVFKFVTEEHKQIIQKIQQKNHQIKEVIDKIRTIIWEINTMIVMRKT